MANFDEMQREWRSWLVSRGHLRDGEEFERLTDDQRRELAREYRLEKAEQERGRRELDHARF